MSIVSVQNEENGSRIPEQLRQSRMLPSPIDGHGFSVKKSTRDRAAIHECSMSAWRYGDGVAVSHVKENTSSKASEMKGSLHDWKTQLRRENPK